MEVPDTNCPADFVEVQPNTDNDGLGPISVCVWAGGTASAVYLSKADATRLGLYLIELGEEPEVTLCAS